MSAYFIANIRIRDFAGYEKYLQGVDDVFKKCNGEYLAVDEKPEILEGKWDYTKTVLIRFPDKESLKRWYFSEDYQRILRYRLAAADCDTILAEGK